MRQVFDADALYSRQRTWVPRLPVATDPLILAGDVLRIKRGDMMRGLTLLMLAAAIAISLTAAAPNANAQVGVGVEVGPAPVCPYGYYDVPPYNCAPYGYYGPEWFTNGVFIGVGPWFHGREGFFGHVDNHFHPEHGYRGPFPERGERASRPLDRIEHFHGNEMRDGHGHVTHR